MKSTKLRTLGKKVTKFTNLDTFRTPPDIVEVICTSDEVTAVCPITQQPDWYVVRILYRPREVCVESKSLKLFLQSFRNSGHFCENFSSIIAHELMTVLGAEQVEVRVTQKPRGGIAIESTARIFS